MAPPYRARMFDLFLALLTACHAERIETQSNDTLLTVMLHMFAQNVAMSPFSSTTSSRWPTR